MKKRFMSALKVLKPMQKRVISVMLAMAVLVGMVAISGLFSASAKTVTLIADNSGTNTVLTVPPGVTLYAGDVIQFDAYGKFGSNAVAGRAVSALYAD